MGLREAATGLCRQVLKIRELVLGHCHRDMVASATELAAIQYPQDLK